MIIEITPNQFINPAQIIRTVPERVNAVEVGVKLYFINSKGLADHLLITEERFKILLAGMPGPEVVRLAVKK